MTVMTNRLLEGVRVLDFSWLAAGPTGTLLLAAHGAEVIRVESRLALDTYRRVFRQGEDPDRSELFASVNYNKKSVTFNLKDENAREIIGRIVPEVDVVVENFSPGTLDRLGLGYESLRSDRSDLVMVSCSSTGHTGPLVRNAGYAPIFAALGGLVSATWATNGQPSLYGRQFDARVGTFVALAALTGLLQRSRTGNGGHYDVSGQEVAATMCSEATANVYAGQEPFDAEIEDYVRCFQCTDGRWVVVEVDPGNHRVLAGAVLELFSELHGQAIAVTAEAFAQTVRAAGHTATIEVTADDVLGENALVESGLFGQIEQPGLGSQLVIGSPVHWSSELMGSAIKPAPRLGEHTREVLENLGGFSALEIDDLERGRSLV